MRLTRRHKCWLAPVAESSPYAKWESSPDYMSTHGMMSSTAGILESSAHSLGLFGITTERLLDDLPLHNALTTVVVSRGSISL